jgi:hypothetical protein
MLDPAILRVKLAKLLLCGADRNPVRSEYDTTAAGSTLIECHNIRHIHLQIFYANFLLNFLINFLLNFLLNFPLYTNFMIAIL